MTGSAPHLNEQVVTVLNGWRTSRAGTGGRGLIQEFHESHEGHDIGGVRTSHIKAGVAFRRAVGGAIRIFFALIRKIVIGYAHLHVVRLAREDLERFVLRLPSEPRDGAVVAVRVQVSLDAEESF